MSSDLLVVDLRTDAEAGRDPIGGALRLPIPKPPLTPRQICRMAEDLFASVPRRRSFGVVCAKGVRSSLATAMLAQAGFPVVNLGGMNSTAVRQTLRRMGYKVGGMS